MNHVVRPTCKLDRYFSLALVPELSQDPFLLGSTLQAQVAFLINLVWCGVQASREKSGTYNWQVSERRIRKRFWWTRYRHDYTFFPELSDAWTANPGHKITSTVAKRSGREENRGRRGSPLTAYMARLRNLHPQRAVYSWAWGRKGAEQKIDRVEQGITSRHWKFRDFRIHPPCLS